jgi:hypothetical protein
VSSNAEILMRAFANGWGKGKPPELADPVHVDAELIAPTSMPYGGGVFRGRERIPQWFAEDLWEMWTEFSSTPTDLIDGGDTIVVPRGRAWRYGRPAKDVEAQLLRPSGRPSSLEPPSPMARGVWAAARCRSPARQIVGLPSLTGR